MELDVQMWDWTSRFGAGHPDVESCGDSRTSLMFTVGARQRLEGFMVTQPEAPGPEPQLEPGAGSE